MTRGILFMVWGENEKVNAALPRAIASVEAIHPELEHHVCKMPDGSDLRCKARMLDLSPFDTTLYLDVDTVLLGRMDHAFAKAEQHSLAICINPHPWARRYDGLHSRGEITEYDTGVVAFTKKAKPLFEEWKAGEYLNSRSFFFSATGGLCQMPVNDQCAFAAAVDKTGFNPHVLPVNFNFHHKWQPIVFGPVKVWHDYGDVPDAVVKWNEEQTGPGAVLRCVRFKEEQCAASST